MEQHRLINWTAGMKMTKATMEETENFFMQSIIDNQIRSLNGYNFGLLPTDGKNSSAEIEITNQVTDGVEVKLKSCHAITEGGYTINCIPDLQNGMVVKLNSSENKTTSDRQEWDVVLAVKPFNRNPYGIPDADEVPLRKPYVEPEYDLSIHPKGSMQSSSGRINFLVIGRIRVIDGRFEVDSNYIPPCINMLSHSDLMKYYERLGQLLSQLEKAAKKITDKVQNRSENTSLGMAIDKLCCNLMMYIATIYYGFRNHGKWYAPSLVVGTFSSLAHISYISLQSMNRTEREELLKYFYEWSDVTPGTFEEILASMLNILYDHNNIRTVMVQTEHFMEIMVHLWDRLSGLEYIGQHKDNVIISERYQTQEKTTVKEGWSVID